MLASRATGAVAGHSDVGPLTVETLIAGLKPTTLYRYRMVATNAVGPSDGADHLPHRRPMTAP